MSRLSWGAGAVLGLALGAVLAVPLPMEAQEGVAPPGAVDPSACRVGAVLSLEQFTTTGFSAVRFARPGSAAVAGAWALADNRVRHTGVVASPNCPVADGRIDGHDLNVMGVRIRPTASGLEAADVQQIKLVQDVNLNGTWEPGLDQTLKVKPGEALAQPEGARFRFGPQAPMLQLGDNDQICTIETLRAPAGGNATVFFSDGKSVIAGEYEVRSEVTGHVTVLDAEANDQGNARETVQVNLESQDVGDDLNGVELTETEPNTGVFRGSFTLGDSASSGADTLTAQDGDTLKATYQGEQTDEVYVDVAGSLDAIDAPNDFDKIQLYIDENGNDTFDPGTDPPATAISPGETFFLAVFDAAPATSNKVAVDVVNANNRDAEEIDAPPENATTSGPALVGVATNAVPSEIAPANRGDGILQAEGDQLLEITSLAPLELAGAVRSASVVFSQATELPCAVGLLAVLELGSEVTTGAQLGLEMEAAAGDIPGTPEGRLGAATSSAFAPIHNRQASNLRLLILGGEASSVTPLTHLANGSGNPESDVEPIEVIGTGLATRFREPVVTPGTREAVAMLVGVCDGGVLVNSAVNVLPPTAGAAPSIAGGLAALPCENTDQADSLLTGISGAVLAFTGPGARHLGTVRLYADEDADGTLFEPGELVQQAVPTYNRPTEEAIAVLGGAGGQILVTGNGTPLVAGAVACASDPCTPSTSGVGIGFRGGTNNFQGPEPADAPLLMAITVDVDATAPTGTINVRLGMQTYDDTDQAGSGRCDDGFAGRNCGSTFQLTVPASHRFEIKGPDASQAGSAYGDDGRIEDADFLAALQAWADGRLAPRRFTSLMAAWKELTGISRSVPRPLRLDGIDLSQTTTGVRFRARGDGIAETAVQVFRLDGQRIARRSVEGQALTWVPSDASGQPLANGVYLAQMTVRNETGRHRTSEVYKIVIRR